MLTVVLGNGGFAPCRKQGIWTKTAKMTNLHSTNENKGFGPQNPENDKMTGVTQVNPWFTKSGVFTTPIKQSEGNGLERIKHSFQTGFLKGALC